MTDFAFVNHESLDDAYYRREQPFADLPFVLLHQNFECQDTGQNQHDDFYALYVTIGGRGLHVINGHPYSIARGDVYIAPPGSVHAYRDSRNLRATAFCFRVEVFSPAEREALRGLSGFWNLRVDENHHGAARGHRLHLSPERLSEAEILVGEIEDALKSRDAVARVLLVHGFFRLLVYLARAQESQTGTHAGDAAKAGGTANGGDAAHDAGLARVLRECETRFAEPISVPQLAAMMFLSPGRFSEVFSSHMGVAPATYLRRLRLERAQTLLRTSDLPAYAIAAQVGFSDAAQFSRAFRAAFGLTPSSYRATFKPKSTPEFGRTFPL